MNIQSNGEFVIIAYNINQLGSRQEFKSNLENYPCTSYNGNDYRDMFGEPFSYPEVFRCIIKNLRADKGTLPSHLELDKYETPADKESFQKSPLWKDLGFKISEGFEIVGTTMEIEIFHEHSVSQRAMTHIDIELEDFLYDYQTAAWNALDKLLYEWPMLFNKNGEHVHHLEVLASLVKFYRFIGGNKLDRIVRDYCSNLFHELQSKGVTNMKTALTQAEVQAILDIIHKVQAENEAMYPMY